MRSFNKRRHEEKRSIRVHHYKNKNKESAHCAQITLCHGETVSRYFQKSQCFLLCVINLHQKKKKKKLEAVTRSINTNMKSMLIL